jgi:transcriptional regulator with PAS, ATPase and Fis domain
MEQRLSSLKVEDLRTTNAAMTRCISLAKLAAKSEVPIVLLGETGTGKTLLAQAVYNSSARAQGPFISFNASAMSDTLLESQLFGHEKGAFTGAHAARAGRLDQAATGTLFLDEVAEMSPTVQAKFLRVLQEREYQRLGGTKTLKADVRVIAATNHDLKAAITRGTFREDLFYRLAVFDIALPPLRERADDIPLLVNGFIEEISRQVGRPAAGISKDAMAALTRHSWPGNVRELRNAIERAVILCEGGLIEIEHLPRFNGAASGSAGGDGPRTIGDAEREMIAQALAKSGNNKSQAARLLGLTRAQLRTRIEKYGLGAEG